MRAGKILLSLILSTLVASVAHSMTQDEYTNRLRQWHQATNQAVSWETFEKGTTWFLTKCASGNCDPCLLTLSDNTHGSTTHTWIGSFDSSGPKTIIATKAAINDGNTVHRDGKTHTVTPSFAGKYGRCIEGSSKFSCSGDTCRLGGGHHNTTYPASTVAQLEQHLGEDVRALIMYGVVFQGQLMFHDGLHCYGRSDCAATWGCLVQYPKQQRDLCRNYINPNGGIHVYIDSVQKNNNKGNWQQAAKAMEKGNFCRTVSGPAIQVHTPTTGSSTGPVSRSRAGMDRYNALREQRDSVIEGSNYNSSTTLSGNSTFQNCQATSSRSYSENVAAANNGETDTSRTQLAQDAASVDSVYGGGETNARATSLNNMDKNCRTGEATEPRSGGFFASIGSFFTSLFGGSSTTNGTQSLGTPEADPSRFSPGREVTTNFSTQQDMQMEAAIQAQDTSIQFDQAETQLYKSDAEAAKVYFNNQSGQYANEGDKQASANEYGIGNSNNKFRDSALKIGGFHSMRASVLSEHHSAFPTTQRLLERCKQKSAAIEQSNPVYDVVMEETRKHYDEEFNDSPTYEGDRCSDYIENNKEYAALNEHIPGQLEPMIEDSLAIVKGMDEVVAALDDTSLSEGERLKLAAGNSVWEMVAERQQALEACDKVGCLDELSGKLTMLTSYEGSASYGPPSLRDAQSVFKSYQSSNTLPSDYFKNFMNTTMKNFDASTLGSEHGNNGITKTGQGQKDLRANQAKLVDGNMAAGAQNLALSNMNTQLQGGQGLKGETYRDENGVLRSKDGKEVWGFEAAKHHNLFEIISNRYRQKFTP